jgi:hypothetical protein
MTEDIRALPLARVHTELLAALLAVLTCGLLFSTPTLAAVSFVQAQALGSSANVAQLSVTFSSAQQAGDLNVVMIGWRDATAIQSVTDTKGNTLRWP